MPVCSLVGDATSGAEFSPFPSPLPPASGGAGPVRSRLAPLELLSPFVLRMAGSVFGPVNFLFFAVPQFKLVSHKSSLQLPSGHSGQVLTLSNAACSSPFCPHLLVADAGIWGTFLLGVAFRHISCGFYLFFSQLGCPPRFKNFPQTPQCEGFLMFGNFLYYTSLPGTGLCLLLFCLSFYLLHFVLPPFEDSGLLFWVPDVLS